MKKYIALLLAAALLAGVCGCTSTPQVPETSETPPQTDPATEGTAGPVQEGFRVGFGKVNITPEEDVPMGGYGNSAQRVSDSVLNYLYATCIAITDEDGNSALVTTVDMCSIPTEFCDEARTAISRATGVPYDAIILSATHSHCTPDMTMATDARIARYNNSLLHWLEEAAQQALDDRLPVTGMYINTVMTEGLNFVRHYNLSEGIVAGDNHNHDIRNNYEILSHTTEADHSLQLLKFTREGGKDVVLTNFQTHPHRAGGSKTYHLAADLVGVYRDALEEAMGGTCQVAYFSGASGNINATSWISSEMAAKDYIETGEMLAQYAAKGLENMTQVSTGKVSVQDVTVDLPVNQEDLDKYNDAVRIQSMWDATHDATTVLAECRRCGIYSPFHASAIILRNSLAGTWGVYANCLSIGDVAFAAGSNELFDTNGMYIKENSPYAMTFVLTLANGSKGYIPSQQAFDYGCYEADTTRVAPGSGEVLAQKFVDMLTELYNAR